MQTHCYINTTFKNIGVQNIPSDELFSIYIKMVANKLSSKTLNKIWVNGFGMVIYIYIYIYRYQIHRAGMVCYYRFGNL